MKIAIPVFQSRVAPRFDCAERFLLVEAGSDGETSRSELAFVEHGDPTRRVRDLLDWGLEVLICGGIERFPRERLEGACVRVYSCVTGPADDALRCFLKGRLVSDAMVGTGGRCGRWRFRRRGACPR